MILPPQALSVEKCFVSSCVGVGRDRVVSFVHIDDVTKKTQKRVRKKENVMIASMMMEEGEVITGVLDEQGEGESLDQVIASIEREEFEIEISRELHVLLSHFVHEEVHVNTKYKTVDKKVRPVAVPLPLDARELIRRAQEEPRLRDPKGIGHKFTKETLEKLKIGGDGLLTEIECEVFKKMVQGHGKAFAFKIEEIGCVNP